MKTEINDGGKAFPVPGITLPDGSVAMGTSGMTLRDYFAGQALSGVLSSGDLDLKKVADEPEKLACITYAVSDAMIKARGK